MSDIIVTVILGVGFLSCGILMFVLLTRKKEQKETGKECFKRDGFYVRHGISTENKVIKSTYEDVMGITGKDDYPTVVKGKYGGSGCIAGDHVFQLISSYEKVSYEIIFKNSVIIGRNIEAKQYGEIFLEIHDKQVSRRHCKVTYHSGRYLVEDLGSTNGTYLDGKQVTEPGFLKNGAILQIGKCDYQIYISRRNG